MPKYQLFLFKYASLRSKLKTSASEVLRDPDERTRATIKTLISERFFFFVVDIKKPSHANWTQKIQAHCVVVYKECWIISISNLASIPFFRIQRNPRCSGHWAALHLLRHLFGAVVGQAKTHNGQHHGDLIKGAVLRLGLNLTGYLPLKEG